MRNCLRCHFGRYDELELPTSKPSAAMNADDFSDMGGFHFGEARMVDRELYDVDESREGALDADAARLGGASDSLTSSEELV